MTPIRRTPLLAALFIIVSSFTVLAANDPAEDSDILLANARVVEVNDKRIAVIARSGVEHVIAVGSHGTKVKMGSRVVALREVREGDLVTIELDEKSMVKLARNIQIKISSTQQFVRNRRP